MANQMNSISRQTTGLTAVFALTVALLASACIGTGTDVGNPGLFDTGLAPDAGSDTSTTDDASAGADTSGESDSGAAPDTSTADTTEPMDTTADTVVPDDTSMSDAEADSISPDTDLPHADVSDVTEDASDIGPLDADTDDAMDGDVTGDADATPGDTSDDAGADVSADVETDTIVVTDPYEGRPAGQCVGNTDCPGEFTFCADTAPGGICNGCTPGGTDCPAGTECGSFGACQRDCDTVEDCPLGLTCSGGGVCILLRCVSGVCPVPQFTCNESGLCNRAACGPATPCPTGTSCIDEICVEDNLVD